MNNIKNFINKPSYFFPPHHSKFRSQSGDSSYQKSVQVSILGANSRLGIFTSFLMKQIPTVSRLHLQGCFPIESIGMDLNFFDTRCEVETYVGMEQSIPNAIKGADIILVLPCEETRADTPIGERIMKQGKRLYNIAMQCTLYAPRAILIVNVPPVSVSLPFVAEIFKKTNFYHPGRLIGSAAIAQMKANTLLGRYQDLNPANCYCPIIGGPDIDLAVPLYSKGKPVEVIGNTGPTKLTARFRGIKEDEFPKNSGNPNYVEDCAMAESYALNQLISSIALGICGDPKAFANVYLRCKILDICKYLVTTVRFSRGGVVHTAEIPTLTKLELDLLEKAALQLNEREKMAQEYLKYIEEETFGKDDEPKLPSFVIKEKQQQELLEQKVVR